MNTPTDEFGEGVDPSAAAMYREHILHLYKHPHHFGVLKDATHTSRAFNPLCGDDLTLHLVVKKGKITNVSFSGVGCAISMAAASLLTDKLMGMEITDAKKLNTEQLLALLGIPIGPVRLKCANLILRALDDAGI